MINKKYKVVSLFSGAGGLDLGFHQAGFDVIWANDIDKFAVQTYRENFDNDIVLGDINNIDFNTIPAADVVIGGFPCQPFSMMGSELGFEDARGTVFFTVANLIKNMIENGNKPKVVVLENVRRLLTHDGGNTFKVIKHILEKDLDYKVFFKVLNSADYGVPQTRNRIFIVCFDDKNINFEFPQEKKLTSTMQDLLESNVNEKYFLSDKLLKTILANGSGNYRAKSEIDLKIARPLCSTMHKMHRACQDNYVTDKGKVRRLTPREAARLQGFPDDFVIPVSDTQAYRQFGNAVTVNVAKSVADCIMEVLNEENNYMDAIELREILKINKDLLNEKFCEENYSRNLELLTCKTEDQYLNDRGIKFKEVVKNDTDFRLLIGKLDFNKVKDIYILKYFNSWCVEQRNTNSSNLNFIDLFCGAGGLSLGFLQEGFDVNFACDIEEACIETYRFNHPNVPSKYIVNDDIKNIENKINDYIRFKEVDLVIGGPPCQGFSIANQQRIIDDPRNKLYKSFVNVVDKTKPKLFVMENVKGMLKVAQQVKEDFESIGYKVSYKVFNAQDFGVPQNRERLIFIGSRLDVRPEEIISRIESLVADGYVLKDAIDDLNELEASREKNNTNILNDKNGGIVIRKTNNNVSDYVKRINNGILIENLVFNHQARYNNDRDIEIYGRLHQGDKSDDPKIEDIMPYANRSHIFKDKYYKLKNDDKCKTITAHMKFDCNMYIHPTQARVLLPREAARVQSYPDDYVFKGSFTKTYMQVGNSVPPLMGRGIASIIKKILEEVK